MRYVPLVVLMSTALGGCMVGPDDRARPAVPGAQAGWIAPGAPAAVDRAWWQALGDRRLDALVDAALAGNLDIRAAQARLREARANRDAAAGRLMPEIGATGSASRSELSEHGQLPLAQLPGFARQYSLFDAGFDASWEIDLWGGGRRAVEGAQAQTRAAAARIDDIRLQTIAEVARSYTDLRSAQARLANVHEDAEIRAALAGLVAQRFAAGEASASDLAQAQQRADTTRAGVAGIRADIRAAIYRLGLLTARPPEALVAELDPPAPMPAPPPLLATGIRSDLLRRRADVRIADADLAAATANIGVETANLYPRFSLVGALGQQSRALSDFSAASSTRFQAGPSFSWPIFSFGRIRAQIHAAKAGADVAAVQYEKAVLGALGDSETAVNRLAAARTVQADRAAASARSSAATAFAARRYHAGEEDRLAWLEARSAGLAVEQQALSAQADTLQAYIALAKALGGTWDTPQK